MAKSPGAVGSPLWMAPEQTMKGGAITPAADVWALGLLAFQALSGHYYWNAPNGVGGTPMTLLREITLDAIEPASVRSKALGGAPLPPGFDEWFARCLERDPSARFRDASEATPPLLALLAAAPKRASRAIEMAVTQGIPPKPAAVVEEVVPAPPARTGTSFTNTGQPKPLPRRIAPTARVALVALAALAALGGLGAFAGYRPIKRLATGNSAEAAHAKARAAPMIGFGGDTFIIGSDAGADDERPPTTISVAGFTIDTREVAVASYLACVDAGPCKQPGAGPGCNAADPNRRDHPINCVGYADAKTYCEWVDRRLPSETEWERAARGGKAQRRYPWGDAPPSNQLCWRHDEPNHGGTCPIGAFPAGNTPEGLEDMAGNVWEWTTARYCTYGTSNCTDERRVARGGSWASDDAAVVTTTVRNEIFESDRGASMGFRCARSL
jgi:formylglycine-generating enzyme required for sulfatase activity